MKTVFNPGTDDAGRPNEDPAEWGFDKVRVRRVVHVDENAVGGEPLRAVAGDRVQTL